MMQKPQRGDIIIATAWRHYYSHSVATLL